MEQSLPDPNVAFGDHRCPGPSYRDLVLRDETGVPAQMLESEYRYRGSEPIGYHRYTSKEFAELEFEKVFMRAWQWACREEHIPNEGDYHVYDVGQRSIILVRDPQGKIRAFNNFCLHRGTQLKPSGDQGNANRFTCPYHGWAWSTTGKIASLPCRWDFPHLSDDDLEMPEIQVDTWGGFVFVNFDPTAGPLRDYLGVLPEHFQGAWDLSKRYVELHIKKRLPCNWKAGMAAFLEAYHVYKTHPQGLRATGDANAQYDVFGEHISRFMHTSGTQSPHIANQQTEQEILDFLLGRKFSPGMETPKIPEGKTARDVYAQLSKVQLGEKYGADYSDFKVADTVDSIEYFVFPNGFFFPGARIPLTYRFLPNPDNPDECTFDLLFLRPHPADGNIPAPAKVCHLDFKDSYASAPGMDPGLGGVFDQDTDNLAAQTRGFKGSMRTAETLGNYQEIRTRHLHETIDKYMARP
ncbi:MAG: Rieske 2Fe-2S domain-containing protein [Actinobacteria bacterium]|jgi:phenylpropionate dioxygenase-like ring-hydroxylating dioxygenase large terminal subunit|nr:aromatic ring-hydroxylating dioxygenase subunit alpha [Actinomycetota bacterium]MSV60342.1 Rieske 2Fe-2S domain-containing protein [Actinomycetota bacterium]MTH93186.1 Rieske 2Fe-2S domain-containing protein [Actinomycetota bacterium]